MDYMGIPIIIICCYMFGELYKFILRTKQDTYQLIPVLVGVLGGLMGIVIYFTSPETILNADNVWVALGIGIVSGVSSTGTN